MARVVLLPLALAAVLGYLVLPLVRRLEQWHLPKGLAAAMALVSFFALMAGLGFWGWPRLCRDIMALGGLAPQAGLLLERINRDLPAMLTNMHSGDGGLLYVCLGQLGDRLGDILGRAVEQSLNRLPGVIGSCSLLIFTPVFAFYLLKDRESLLAMIPRDLRALAVDLNHILQAFVRGYLLVAVVVGSLFGLAVWVFGLRYAFTLGLLMLLAELVPYLGPFLAFFPCVALGALQGRLALIKLLLIWFAVQQLENLLISPHIMSGVMKLPPFYIMLAVLVGGFWWGIFGMILAVPLAAAIRTVGNAALQWWQLGDGISGEPEAWIK